MCSVSASATSGFLELRTDVIWIGVSFQPSVPVTWIIAGDTSQIISMMRTPNSVCGRDLLSKDFIQLQMTVGPFVCPPC
jgi:hypothetical protein